MNQLHFSEVLQQPVEVRRVEDGARLDALNGGLPRDGFFGWEGRVLFGLDCPIEGFQVHAGSSGNTYLLGMEIGRDGELWDFLVFYVLFIGGLLLFEHESVSYSYTSNTLIQLPFQSIIVWASKDLRICQGLTSIVTSFQAGIQAHFSLYGIYLISSLLSVMKGEAIRMPMIRPFLFYAPLQQMNNSGTKEEQEIKQPSKNEVSVTEDQQGRKIYTFAGFPAHPFKLDPEYELDAIKGWGTFGLVASGRNTITGQPVAVKRVNQVFDNLGDAKRILREIKILKFLKHKNIVGLKDMMRIQPEEVVSFNEVYLCMEYMDYTLHRLIHSQQVPLTEQMIQFILYQLFSAIHYMHSADIIHRDMKPENILINKKLELKLADMNLARKEIITEEVTYYVTTRPYRAPEIFISANTYTKAIDIWSIGCILAQMLGKTVLFQGKDYVDQLRRFVAILGKPTLEIFPDLDPVTLQGLNKVFKDIPDREKVDWKFLFPKASEKALDLLNHMLVFDPRARYTAEECLNHPFLEEFKKRPRTKCKDVFDFQFDKIELTMENLRNAIYQESEYFQEKKKRKPESIDNLDNLEKRVKSD